VLFSNPQGLVLRLTDTGGLESRVATEQNDLLGTMRFHAMRAVQESEVVLFLIDAREGITPLDMEVASLLRAGRPTDSSERKPLTIILVANKAEGNLIGPYLNDCYDLGVGDPVIVSATQNHGKTMDHVRHQ